MKEKTRQEKTGREGKGREGMIWGWHRWDVNLE